MVFQSGSVSENHQKPKSGDFDLGFVGSSCVPQDAGDHGE